MGKRLPPSLSPSLPAVSIFIHAATSKQPCTNTTALDNIIKLSCANTAITVQHNNEWLDYYMWGIIKSSKLDHRLCSTKISKFLPLMKCTLTVPMSYICDTAVLATATVLSPRDGIKVVSTNKHCQLTEGITT